MNTLLDKPRFSAWELRRFLGGISLDALVDRVALGRLPVPEVDGIWVWWETEKFLAGQDSDTPRNKACAALRRLVRGKTNQKKDAHHGKPCGSI